MPFPIEKKFLVEKFYLLLPVEKPEIPKHIAEIAKENKLNEKPDYHISVVVEKSAAIIRREIAKSSYPERIAQEVVDLFKGYAWEYTLSDKYSLQEKFYDKESRIAAGLEEEPEHMRRSIIQIVEMPDIEHFYRKLSEILEIELDVPIPHITIFAWSDYALKSTRGIGISSKQDFETCHKNWL